jgi:hypothetical protein
MISWMLTITQKATGDTNNGTVRRDQPDRVELLARDNGKDEGVQGEAFAL